MRHILKNEFLTVAVDTLGAEVQSVQDAQGMERMWQADPAVWGRHAPLLFPIIGRLKEKRYTIEGQPYEISQHGFGRDREFSITAQDDTQVDFTLEADAQTLACYPFAFSLTIRYRLEGTTLHKTHLVTNKGNKPMLYEVGGHDALRLNLNPGERMEDYQISFPETAVLQRFQTDAHVFLTEEKETIALQDGALRLTPELFARDALILDTLPKQELTLSCTKHAKRVTLSFADFSYLGIWTKYGFGDTGFVCVEPWSTLPEFGDADSELAHKHGIRTLAPAQTEALTFSLTFTG